MKFLAGSTLQKVIATIVAAILSFSVITPAISNTKINQKPTGIVQTVKKVDGKIVAVEPEKSAPVEEETAAPEDEAETEETAAPEETAPVAETEETAAQTDETAAPEAQAEEAAAPEETAPAAETQETAAPEAIAQWDVSATEEDDVQMYYYADDSFLDTVVGAVRALFVPITALAEGLDEGEEPQDNEVAQDNGVLYIAGNGDTEGMLFFNLVEDKAKFAAGYEAYCASSGVDEDRYYVNYNNLDNGYIVNYWDTKSAQAVHTEFTGENGVINYEEMFETYFPWNLIDMVIDTEPETFWNEYGKLVPSKVVIGEGVTSIGYAAFAFCTNITEVQFLAGSTINTIDTAAFAGTGLSEIDLPAGIKEIGDSSFETCVNLETIIIPSGVTRIGESAFLGISNGSTIYCGDGDVLGLLVDEDDFGTAETGTGRQSSVIRNYDSTITDYNFGRPGQN